jgi:hypothetical protein
LAKGTTGSVLCANNHILFVDSVGKYPICCSFRRFLAIECSLKSNEKKSKNLEKEGRNAIWRKRDLLGSKGLK